MTTEDEARKRWCPFARVGTTTTDERLAVALNRVENTGGIVLNPFAARCIASDCMAWRW